VCLRLSSQSQHICYLYKSLKNPELNENF